MPVTFLRITFLQRISRVRGAITLCAVWTWAKDISRVGCAGPVSLSDKFISWCLYRHLHVKMLYSKVQSTVVWHWSRDRLASSYLFVVYVYTTYTVQYMWLVQPRSLWQAGYSQWGRRLEAWLGPASCPAQLVMEACRRAVPPPSPMSCTFIRFLCWNC